MPETKSARRLAAIVAADVVEYSRLMHEDEEETIAAWRQARTEVIEPGIAKHGGRLVKHTGDGFLAEFGSVSDAVHCAVNMQQSFAAGVFQFRFGINIGEVVDDGGDIYGDGVNIAARLEELAHPGGICISGDVYNQIHNKMDLAFTDIGKREVKNISTPVRIYRIEMGIAPGRSGPIRARSSRRLGVPVAFIVGSVAIAAAGYVWRPWTGPPPREAALPAVETPGPQTEVPREKPTVAVLPFVNISGDKEQEYFSDGMTEDLITDLSKVSGLIIIARNSTAEYKGQTPDVREVGKALNAGYVVGGSVQKSGGRIRINAQLIETGTGGHLWAERYDRELNDVFSIQDEVVAKIATALRVSLTPAEERRLARAQTNSPEAYDLYLKGLREESYFSKEGNLNSQRFFLQAIDRDPAFAAAHAHLAQAYSLAIENSWSERVEELQEMAMSSAQRSLELDDELPYAHWSFGRILTRPPIRDPQRALQALQRAVELNPNFADGHAFLANVLIYVGRAEEALGGIETAMRINPRYPFWHVYVRGLCLYLLGRFEEAIPDIQAAIERNPNVPWPHRWLAAAYGQLGNADDAEWELSELESLGQMPTLKGIREHSPIVYEPYLELYLDGLRKAGVPEE